MEVTLTDLRRIAGANGLALEDAELARRLHDRPQPAGRNSRQIALAYFPELSYNTLALGGALVDTPIPPTTLEELRAVASANGLALDDDALLERLRTAPTSSTRDRWATLLHYFPELDPNEAVRPVSMQ